MTDKVQKIRNEVERLQKELIQEREKGLGSDADDTCILELQNVLTYIDFLQKESEPQFKVGDTIRNKHWDTAVHKIISMDDKSYCLDNGGKVDISSQQLWELVKEPVNEEWVEELRTKLDSMSKEDFKKVFDKYAIDFKEESASEELEKASYRFACKCHPLKTECSTSSPNREVIEAFKTGAKWQKEQMITKAIDGIARPDDNEIWCNLSTFNFKDGDKCKVILIKEDRT